MRNPNTLRLLPTSEDLAVAVYKATAAFPNAERWGLTSQMRRASISVGSNIAEGSLRQGDRAFLPFLHNSLGSTGELRFQLGVAQRLDFGRRDQMIALIDDVEHVKAMLINFIAALKP